MKLIFIDPGSSGLQISDCSSPRRSKKVLSDYGLDKNTSADIIYYIFMDQQGQLTKGQIDFS